MRNLLTALLFWHVFSLPYSVFRYTAPQLNTAYRSLNTAQLTRAHLVQPGDTWDALARRYGLAPADLAPLQGVNPQREPVIGAVLALPDSGVEHAGALWRTADGSLLATALRFNRNPWAVALQNDLRHPYHPLAYQPLFLPGGAAPPRDLPVGFTQLDLSHVPAQPGQAIAYRGQTLQPITVTAKLSLAPLGSFGNGRFQLGLGGTGAFFGSQDPELAILPAGQPLWAQPWRFVDRQWDFEELTLTGSAAQINQADILAERERLFEIWNQASPTPQWTAGFRQPLDSYVFLSSNYGARRAYNGGPYDRYHEGVDFAAYGGTPVLAAAAGTVVIAETLFVRGGAVIIDHGLGVYTGYYHMAAVLVNPGDVVQAGQIVGEVGSTGLSTGNHLHWDLLVNGVWVDAAAWTEQDMACWLLPIWQQACS